MILFLLDELDVFYHAKTIYLLYGNVWFFSVVVWWWSSPRWWWCDCGCVVVWLCGGVVVLWWWLADFYIVSLIRSRNNNTILFLKYRSKRNYNIILMLTILKSAINPTWSESIGFKRLLVCLLTKDKILYPKSLKTNNFQWIWIKIKAQLKLGLNSCDTHYLYSILVMWLLYIFTEMSCYLLKNVTSYHWWYITYKPHLPVKSMN